MGLGVSLPSKKQGVPPHLSLRIDWGQTFLVQSCHGQQWLQLQGRICVRAVLQLLPPGAELAGGGMKAMLLANTKIDL